LMRAQRLPSQGASFARAATLTDASRVECIAVPDPFFAGFSGAASSGVWLKSPSFLPEIFLHISSKSAMPYRWRFVLQ
jgi:hypothetical protein